MWNYCFIKVTSMYMRIFSNKHVMTDYWLNSNKLFEFH